MASSDGFQDGRLDRFREYLRLLAQLEINPGLQAKLGPSDLVQQTLLEAFQKRGQFLGTTDAELAGWLRRILAHNLADALRAFHRDKRNLAREHSLEDSLQKSSGRLENWLADDTPTPSAYLQEQERAVLLANALAQLPESQRQALVLQYWHGWKLADIGRQLDRTPEAVAGLLKRGLKKLRQLLQDGA